MHLPRRKETMNVVTGSIGFVETETTYAPDDVETITYHLTDKGLKLLSKLL
jgi:hypothetical protein